MKEEGGSAAIGEGRVKIKSVRANVHVFETMLPLIGKRDSASELVICEIETDDGHAGFGLASRFLCHGIAAAVNRHLGPAIIGLDPRNLEQIHARLHKLVSERGQTIGDVTHPFDDAEVVRALSGDHATGAAA